MAGIARTLYAMPKDYASRPKYVTLFKEMASRIAPCRARMDFGGTPICWIRTRILLRRFPVPLSTCTLLRGELIAAFSIAQPIFRLWEKGWQGLLAHVYEDGRLGSIQAVGAAPEVVPPTSSYVY